METSDMLKKLDELYHKEDEMIAQIEILKLRLERLQFDKKMMKMGIEIKARSEEMI